MKLLRQKVDNDYAPKLLHTLWDWVTASETLDAYPPGLIFRQMFFVGVALGTVVTHYLVLHHRDWMSCSTISADPEQLWESSWVKPSLCHTSLTRLDSARNPAISMCNCGTTSTEDRE